MSVMVKDVGTMPPIPSPPVRQTSRSITDQSKGPTFAVGSWAQALPDDTDFGDIVGLNTAPYSQRYHSTVSVDHQSLSTFRNKASLARLRSQLDTMTIFPELHFRGRIVDPELRRSLGRLNYLRSLPDGWLGEDSCGGTEDAGNQAERLLRRIRSEAPSAPLPVLGLDTDGTIVMSWSRGDLVGSMTIYGDGTFSYFVRRKAASVKNIDAMIDQPLGKDLIDLLAA